MIFCRPYTIKTLLGTRRKKSIADFFSLKCKLACPLKKEVFSVRDTFSLPFLVTGLHHTVFFKEIGSKK